METEQIVRLDKIEHVQPDPLELAARLLEKGADPSSLAGLYDLAKRVRDDKAAEKFGEAIQEFQRRMPPIIRQNPVRKRPEQGKQQGDLLYNFADYADIIAIAGPIMTDLGIVPTFDFKFEGQMMWTTCRVRVGTHVESTTVPLGIPQIPNANDSQRAGGATSYGKRYALCAALNIIVTGEDVDANGLHKTLSEPQTEEINTLFEKIRESGTAFDKKAFWKLMDCTDLNDLPATRFELAKWALKDKLKGNEKRQ